MAWIRRRTPFLTDPEPVECIETERVRGMTIKEVELVGIYQLTHRGLL
jgi:hypothetical protein